MTLIWNPAILKCLQYLRLCNDAKFRTTHIEAAGRLKGVSDYLQSVAMLKYSVQTEFTMVNIDAG
jgi:hypothetical protein